MYTYFQQLFDLLNRNDNHIIIMAVYVALHGLVFLLRVIACMSYRSALFAFRLDAKDLKTRDEIKKIRNGLLRKIAADYIRIADKSVSRIPTMSVVDRHVSALSLLGWRFVSIMPFVESLETGLVFTGLILAVIFGEYAFVYGVLAVAGFLLIRLIAAFFDFREAKQRLADELLIYTEREIGHFFAADAGGAVLRLKNELTDAIGKQSVILKEAIDRIGSGLSEAVNKSLIDINVALQDSMHEWEKALTDAGRVQSQMNASAERMQIAGDRIMSASDLLAKHLQGHSSALSSHLGTLVTAVEAVKESNAALSAEQEAFLKQAQYIDRNQSALETTLQSYEATLQNVTRSLGDGLGAYLKLHAQTAAQTVNDALVANMEKLLGSNQDTLRRITELFDQLRDQSRDISMHLLSMHEKLGVLGQNPPAGLDVNHVKPSQEGGTSQAYLDTSNLKPDQKGGMLDG